MSKDRGMVLELSSQELRFAKGGSPRSIHSTATGAPWLVLQILEEPSHRLVPRVENMADKPVREDEGYSGVMSLLGGGLVLDERVAGRDGRAGEVCVHFVEGQGERCG